MCFLCAGLLTAVHRDYFRVIDYRELLFNDLGDRVAQLLHVESVVPFWQNRNGNIQQQILIVNTHLIFPHNYNLCIVRLHQVAYHVTLQKCTHVLVDHFFIHSLSHWFHFTMHSYS